MSNFNVYLSLVVGFLFLSYLFVGYRLKTLSPAAVVTYLKSTGAWTGIVVFTGGLTIAVFVLSLISQKVNAEEVEYFKYTAVTIGLDYDITDHDYGHGVFCYKGKTSDRITSNGSIQQHLVGYKDIELLGQYTHHSCAFEKDQPTYDAVGFAVKWTFNWK